MDNAGKLSDKGRPEWPGPAANSREDKGEDYPGAPLGPHAPHWQVLAGKVIIWADNLLGIVFIFGWNERIVSFTPIENGGEIHP